VNQRSELLAGTRKAEYRPAGDGEARRLRPWMQRGIAVLQHDLASGVDNAMWSAEVHDHADVIGGVSGDRLGSPLIARAMDAPRHHHECGEGLESEIHVEWNIGQGLQVILQHRAPEHLAENRKPLMLGNAVQRKANRAGAKYLHAKRHFGGKRRCRRRIGHGGDSSR
jgi:hypothetical protein